LLENKPLTAQFIGCRLGRFDDHFQPIFEQVEVGKVLSSGPGLGETF
jgi:hypothetical protein